MPTKREEEENEESIAASDVEAAVEPISSSDADLDSDDDDPEPGWYPNPKEPSKEWFWDGSEWTDQSRPADRSSAAEAAEPSPAPGGLRTDIASAARKMSLKMGAKREIKKLPRHLHDGEVVDEMARGAYGGGTGLLVLTNQRLFFLRDSWTGATHEDYPLERITTVGFSSSLGTGTVSIHASGNTTAISGVMSGDGQRLTAAARKVVGAKPVAPTTAHVPAPVDPIDQIRKLGELKDQGILTQEEFEEKKKGLLDKL